MSAKKQKMSTGKPKYVKKGKKASTLNKQWVKKTQEADQIADEIQRQAGGRGVNPVAASRELPQGGGDQLVPTVEQLAVPIQPILLTGPLQALAMGAIEMSLAKGFGRENSNQPWFAFVYLVNAYISALTGTVPELQVAPRWFWESIHMLRPKSYAMKTGSVAYSWDFRNLPTEPLISYGAGYNLFLGVPNTTGLDVNGFPVLDLPPPYDETQGKVAVQSMFNFFPNTGMYQRVADPGESAYLAKDVSAFQAIFPEWGGSQLSPNAGLAVSVLSEVRMQNPMLAKFAAYQDANNWRGFQHLWKSAGSPFYINPRMSTMLDPREISNKHSPIFKFYNFDHYIVQMSYILAKALELNAKQNAVLPVGQCPLTPWEFQFMFRQAVINKFSNCYAQDLVQQGDNTIPMIPLSVATNGVSIISQGFAEPLFPRLFVESLRAIERKTVKLRGHSHVVFVPVLVRSPDIPQLGNFQYQDATGTYVNIFNDTRVSVDVSMIDLGDHNSSPIRYITANSNQLVELVTTWNNWIRQLQPFLTTLTSLGSESGISVLNTVFCTQHTITIPPPTPAPTITTQPQIVRKASKTDFRGDKLERKRLGDPRPTPDSTSTYYQSVVMESITSTTPILTPVMKYFLSIVKPSYLASLICQQESSTPFQQVLQIETFKVPQTAYSVAFNESAQARLDAQFLAAATYDTRQLLSQLSEVEIDLDEMQKRGDGGFFTSLAGTLGQALGWGEAPQFFDQVGKVINI